MADLGRIHRCACEKFNPYVGKDQKGYYLHASCKLKDLFTAFAHASGLSVLEFLEMVYEWKNRAAKEMPHKFGQILAKRLTSDFSAIERRCDRLARNVTRMNSWLSEIPSHQTKL